MKPALPVKAAVHPLGRAAGPGAFVQKTEETALLRSNTDSQESREQLRGEARPAMTGLHQVLQPIAVQRHHAGLGHREKAGNDEQERQQAALLRSAQRRAAVAVGHLELVPERERDGGAVERPRLVAVTWIPTFGGMMQRVEDVGAICAESGVPYLVDGCQAVGQVDIDAIAGPSEVLIVAGGFQAGRPWAAGAIPAPIC